MQGSDSGRPVRRHHRHVPAAQLHKRTTNAQVPGTRSPSSAFFTIEPSRDPKGTVDQLDPKAATAPPPVVPGPNVKDPAQLVTFYCAACHGPGLGGGLQRNLLQGAWKWARGDNDLERILSNGVAQAGMPATADFLSKDQIKILADFIRARRAGK